MTSYKLTPKPLTKEAFAPFGDVVEIEDQTGNISQDNLIMINGGNTERYDSLAKVQLSSPEDTAVINIFRAQPRSMPMNIEMMERHPRGSQSFHPLSGEDYLVLVADSVEALTPEHLHLFLAKGTQGINYHLNTWHHPVLGLNKVCDFLVVDRKGEGNNCEEFFFDKALNITIDL
ncbi:ureidoglycolate lyase [Litoribrevibacter albus]|uniref:Ureidoglycolate lyase n=1 Tax=Litoribrevibacter albus TaxID=1473156 RepID=A0AA37SE31_9GAMM|nr:ureidoglycolate lyase [Litoribrevibacter albus]GLQ32552.1 ureidoglycolate lyase [Litoribrevibacter albus]